MTAKAIESVVTWMTSGQTWARGHVRGAQAVSGSAGGACAIGTVCVLPQWRAEVRGRSSSERRSVFETGCEETKVGFQLEEHGAGIE